MRYTITCADYELVARTAVEASRLIAERFLPDNPDAFVRALRRRGWRHIRLTRVGFPPVFISKG